MFYVHAPSARPRRFAAATALLALTTLLAPGAFAASQTDSTPEIFDASFGFRDLVFTAADFGGNAGQTIDPANFSVSVNFAKAPGEDLDAPYPTSGSPFYNEIFLQLIAPDNTTVMLVDFNSFNQGAVGTNFDGTITFSSSAASIVNADATQPQTGTFRPVDGDFNAIAGGTAIGTFSLLIQDSKAGDALRYRSFSVNVGSVTAITAPEPGSLALCAGLLPLAGTVFARRRRGRH